MRSILIFLVLVTLGSPIFSQVVASPDEPCWVATKREFRHNVAQMWRGVEASPASAVEAGNLKWELPIAAATGVLIGAVDVPAANRAKSKQVADATDTASNALIGAEFGVALATYAVGCAAHKPQARRLGFTTLSGLGYAIGTDLLLKAAFNREYPDKWNGRGRF